MAESEAAEIEAIKRLKARYFRYLDTKDWGALRTVFTDDFEGEYHGPHPVIHYASPEEMIASNREILAEAATVHHGHMPEVELTGPDTATGVWAMMDIVRLGPGFVGYGHYHEVYRKVGGEWRIARLKLTRLLVDGGVDDPG